MNRKPPATLAKAETLIDGMLFSAETVERAAATLRECLTATCFVRCGRVEGGGLDYREVPDTAIRLTAAVRVIEFAKGKAPTSATLTIDRKPEGKPRLGLDDLARMLREQPALTKTILDTVIGVATNVSPIPDEKGNAATPVAISRQ